MHSLQEKSQITVAGRVEGGENWASAESARDANQEHSWQSQRADDIDPRRFNHLPPGMCIHNQHHSKINDMPLSLSGETDPSGGVNQDSMGRGYAKKSMRAIDNQYAEGRVDLFYGDAGGFVERNNYLDRS